jgi:ribosomal protein S18 acetylase RimI-like enzyme
MKNQWNVYHAENPDFEPWLVLAQEAEPLFGPLVQNDQFRMALQKNIFRKSAFCVRAENGPAGAPILGGLLWSAHPPKFEIGWLAVSNSCRRTGVGTALINHVIRKTTGPASIFVTTFIAGDPGSEAACKIYESLGFFSTGTLQGNPHRQRYELKIP